MYALFHINKTKSRLTANPSEYNLIQAKNPQGIVRLKLIQF